MGDCPCCRRSFSPMRETLGFDARELTPGLVERIVYAAAETRSFQRGKLALEKIGDAVVSTNTIEPSRSRRPVSAIHSTWPRSRKPRLCRRRRRPWDLTVAQPSRPERRRLLSKAIGAPNVWCEPSSAVCSVLATPVGRWPVRRSVAFSGVFGSVPVLRPTARRAPAVDRN